jgi:outer membrane protein OmpA-like peptidoglycan-associated protein
LSRAGFEILYSCALEDCGNHLFFQKLERPFIIDQDHQYLAAHKDLAQGSVWVTVRVYRTARHEPPVRAMVGIVEVGGLEEGLITVNAEAMARDLEQSGHVAVYGVYFNTARAEIKPESEATLQEMVKLLKLNSRLRVFVVGHTDSEGTVAYNMDLSRRRAGSLVAELVSRGIAPERLSAQAVGPFAPVASNRTEQGRAQNRRVELVEQ